MANRTVEQAIGRSWIQISDGTQTKTIQVANGVILLADADESPTPRAPGHIITDWITVTPPTKAWVRAGDWSPTSIIVT